MRVILRIHELRLQRRVWDESEGERDRRIAQEENWERGWMWLPIDEGSLDDEERVEEEVYALVAIETGYEVDHIEYNIEMPKPATVKVSVTFEVSLSKRDTDEYNTQMLDIMRTTKDALRSAGFDLPDGKDNVHAHIIYAQPNEL